VCGGGGKDNLGGGGGDDTVSGGKGDDAAKGGIHWADLYGQDRILLGPGDDFAKGKRGSDVVLGDCGHAGDDRLNGGLGDNTLRAVLAPIHASMARLCPGARSERRA
jgi:serralysin